MYYTIMYIIFEMLNMSISLIVYKWPPNLSRAYIECAKCDMV